jgi:uncharacterized protein YndB with AHSA1/START domain
VETTTERLVIERELAIDASPATVWEFLVDPEKLCRWMGVSASLDVRPGGDYHILVIPGHNARGRFLEVDPPRRLVYTWGWEGPESSVAVGASVVEFELEPAGAGTRLRFVHRDLPSAESVKGHGEGWDHYLTRLTTAAAGGDPGVDPWIRERSS